MIKPRHITAGLFVGIALLLLTTIATGFYFPDAQKYVRGPIYDFYLALAQSEIPNHSGVRKFGKNDTVGTSFEAVTDMSEPYEFPTSAQILDIVSTDADDTGVAGSASGAHTITIVGLDSNWAEQTETVTLTGATVAKTTNAFIRVNRAFIAANGTYGGTNEGDITISTTTDSDTVGKILTDAGQTRQAVYTVPADKTAYIRSVRISAASNKVVEFRARIRLSADDTSAPVSPERTIFSHDGISAPVTFKGDEYNAFPAKTDIWMEAKAASSASAAAAFGIVLADN